MAFSNGYTYRKKITVDATKVSGSGSLTDFPVLVSHTDTALKTVANSGKVENASGYDIRFETSGGTELDYERLFYSATTGQVIAWVQATVDGTTSTEIYLYYGNSSISTDQSDPTGTWDANFKAVYHMTEDPSGSAPQILDSTSNNYDLTTDYAGSAWASGDSTTGKIYKALDFNGTTDSRFLKNVSWGLLTENAARTMEILFKFSNENNQHFISWGAAGGNNLSALGLYGGGIGFLGYGNDNLIDVSDNSYADGAWHHCAITHDGSAMKVIIDGVEKFSGSESLGTDSGNLNIGRFVAGGDYALAVLEEARIHDIGRSNDWIITTWNTINDPSTFYSLGTEETSGGTAYDVVAAVGAFTITGQSTGLSHGTKVASDAGSFALTGQDAGLSFGTGITNDAGAFTLTGQDTGLAHGTSIVAEQGSYTLTGQDTNLSHATIMALESGALTLTGNDVAFTSGYVLGCEPGSYSITGNDATFNLGLTMTADPGSFALTGNDAGLSHGITLNSETGTFVITGQDAGLSTQYVVLTETGGFLLTGQDAALTFSQIMSAETGAFTITGNDAALPIDYKINPETGTFTLTGNNVNLSFSSPSGAGNIIIGIAI